MRFVSARIRRIAVAGALALVVCGARAQAGAPGTPEVDGEADRILRSMSELLSAAREFTFRADVSYDAVVAGQMVQFGGVANIATRHPARLRVSFDGDERKSRLFFDGSTITILDAERNLYAVTDVPPETGAALDVIFERYGFSVPLSDLLYPDPYEVLTANVRSEFLVGQHEIDGTPCHHLAFSQDAIDWQIWIEAGKRPVPRKLVITYKDQPGAPQYTARLSRWNFEPKLSEGSFRLQPPDGASRMEFLPKDAMP